MDLIAQEPEHYLQADDVIEATHPAVLALAAELRAAHPAETDYARAAFEWVRDKVAHSFDAQDSRVTVTASEVLREGVGLCYAKAHLLTALLRAEGIPAGLCYQRLADPATGGHALHGLVALHLDGAWYRQDPRGNKPGVDAQFSLEQERLAWPVSSAAGEVDYPTVHVTPDATVVEALSSTDDVLDLYRRGLPSALPGSAA
ncbi:MULTISPECIES: transglutaminase-like domain-containing protein [Nocardioides]|uniref:Transglutaminase family protein n=1 Tax=Nocardioides vastitatis TaxID=2568655 RepID=A0ABW0ZGB4_9ACTN|nr:transglutaminase family protein [Nocardioides sp.]THI94038.1 transglutaminase family protein [Nocardioides sp.]